MFFENLIFLVSLEIITKIKFFMELSHFKLLKWELQSFYNILRLFDVLLNFLFTTSEIICDYYLYTWYIRAASPVAKRLKDLGS